MCMDVSGSGEQRGKPAPAFSKTIMTVPEENLHISTQSLKHAQGSPGKDPELPISTPHTSLTTSLVLPFFFLLPRELSFRTNDLHGLSATLTPGWLPLV